MVSAPRVGHGYDVHPLVPGRKLILGGVPVDFERGLDGHSDADVVCHAVADSLLGAACLGDIGQHFPDDDEAYKDAASIQLVGEVCSLVRNKGFQVGNIDVTIVAENPKLAPYILQMRQRLAAALDVPIGNVSIKATTNEKMGFLGRGDGIAAFAVALIHG